MASEEGKRHRVLIVDDERVIADTLVVIFRHAGYEAIAAYNGRQGLEKAREFRPQFLISDVVMPDMDGIELAIHLTQEFPGTRVLLISGHTAASQMAGRATRGDYSFPLLAKPIHPGELLHGIAQFVALESRGQAYCVLNVDDNEMQRYAVSRILSAAGFVVWEAKSGEQALQMAARRPDVILLDLNLPDIDGFEVCRRLKQAEPTARIPVIHLTNTYRDEQAAEKSRASGADVFMTHPVSPEQLLDAMKSLLAESEKNGR